MNNKDIPKAYEPQVVEDALYQAWEASGFFNPDTLPGRRKKSFSIAMPPPNATGVLHIGHAVMLAVQDVVIRFQRMQGKKTLWLPGTDHAAIATQSKVERLIKEQEGHTKHDLGREEFLKRVERYVAESRNTIKNQIKKMGSSCDWSRERFTLDADLSLAVRAAFKEMYDDGLIYRGHRIVNWDPKLQTTVSDDEVEYVEKRSPFYYFRYGPFEIGTARAETKFGDKYVVMHPDDDRYKQYQHGEKINLEWINGPITTTVIKDPVIDMEFGTGAMTITPWHDAADFDIAQRHSLEKEQIIDFNGKLLPIAGEFAGMSIADARPRIVEKLKSKGLLSRVEQDYVHRVAINSRGGGLIEPQIKEQWFVNVSKPVKKFGGRSLKEQALSVVKNGDISILPKRFEKIYFHWLENLRDWCISRQIWYGHRIPVYYRKQENPKSEVRSPKSPIQATSYKLQANRDMYVGIEPPKGQDWEQDPDTLDTWFSSGLWTFSTLGWPASVKISAGRPRKIGDLKTFHPTDLMETGYDILFFWVARMIIMSTYLMEEVPFKTVYLHGLVRDEKGRKMSKSLDNIIDPLDMVKQYGADATRLSLLIGSTPGNDTNMSEAKIAGYRNFVNKLWNISRYILMNVGTVKLIDNQPKPKTLADQWVLAELNDLIEVATANLEKYSLSTVGEKVYEFTWNKLADWYVENSKLSAKGGSQNSKTTEEILLYILQVLLKLWHPFTPFVTEEIWKKFNTGELLMIQPWPTRQGKVDMKAVKDFTLVQDLIVGVRNARAQSKIPPAQKLKALAVSPKRFALIEAQANIIKHLARLESLEVVKSATPPKKSLSAHLPGIELYLPVSAMMDVGWEVKRLEAEAARVGDFVTHLAAKLENQRFLEKAPADIVANEKKKLAEHRELLKQIKQQLQTLQ